MSRTKYSLQDAHRWCGNGQREPLALVQQYDKNATGRWDGKVFFFRSDPIVAAGVLPAVMAAFNFRWPRLEVHCEH